MLYHFLPSHLTITNQNMLFITPTDLTCNHRLFNSYSRSRLVMLYRYERNCLTSLPIHAMSNIHGRAIFNNERTRAWENRSSKDTRFHTDLLTRPATRVLAFPPIWSLTPRGPTTLLRLRSKGISKITKFESWIMRELCDWSFGT